MMNKVKLFASNVYTNEYMARAHLEQQINEFAQDYEILNVSICSYSNDNPKFKMSAAVIYKEHEDEISDF